MYINESANLKDSAIFMSFVRHALVEHLVESQANDEVIKYISESAKDCEVLSFAMYGKTCPSENEIFAESMLLSDLKEFMIENSQDFEFNNKYHLNDFIQEIGPIAVTGVDALTFINESMMLNEEEEDTRYGFNKETLGNLKYHAMKKLRKNGFIKNNKLPQSNKVGYADNDASVVSTGNSRVDNEADKVDKIQYVKDKSGIILNDVKKAYETAKGNVMKGWSTFKNYVNTHSGGHGKAIGVAAVVGVAGFLAYKAYQNYFSKAAKACAGKAGDEKKTCMANAKRQAKIQQSSNIKRAMVNCGKTSNPAKCKAALERKISQMSKSS